MSNTLIRISFDPSPKTKPREYKGKSLLKSIDSYVAIDIETTGLDAKFDSILEIGAIRINNGKIINSFESLCYCEDGVSDFITNLTGITNEMIMNAPQLEMVLKNFLTFIGDDILVGHNVNFDINFLYDSCLELFGCFLTNDFVDTLRFARRTYPGLTNYKLETLSQALRIHSLPEHRGLADCYAAFECYEKLKQNVIEKHIELDVLSAGYFFVKAKDIHSEKTCFDESHIFFNKVCVFTGKLEKLTRAEAMQAVVDVGGLCKDTLTKKSNFLILGNLEYCSSIKDGKSTKLKRAEQYILKGEDLQIISENVFYDMLEDLK